MHRLNRFMKNNDVKPSDWLWLAGLVLLGAALRLLYLSASHFIIDADEAIVGLMAKHILDTGVVPVFYYGQHYMGSLEPITTAVLFAIFGSSNGTLHAAPFIWFVLSQMTLYKLCFENMGRTNARIAGLLYAVAPMGFIEWSTKARGGFIEIIFLIAFAFLFLMRAVRANKLTEIRRNLWIAAFVLGVGWWVNNQVVYLFPFAAIVFLITVVPFGLGSFAKVTLLGVVSFLCGSAPYWLYNIVHHGASFGMFSLARYGEIKSHLAGTFTDAIPIILGTRGFNQDDDIFFSAWILADILFAYIILRSVVAFLTDRFSFAQRIMIGGCLVSLATVLVVFNVSIFGSLSIAPRYLLPLYIFLFPLAALHAEFTRSRFLAFVPVSLLLILALTSNYWGGMHISGQPFIHSGERVSKNHDELIEWLRAENITLVRTNYWIGYRLAFETNEQVRFLVFQPPREARIQAYERLVATERQVLETPLVVGPLQAEYIREALRTLEISYRETQKSGYVIFDKISLPWLEQLQEIPHINYAVHTTLSPEEVPHMFDGNGETRWASHKSQSPDMSFSIVFKEPHTIRFIDLYLGIFKNDFPRRLQILIKNNDQDALSPIYTDRAAKSIQYFLDAEHDTGILLKPTKVSQIQVMQTGTDSFFDWSVAELKLFQ